MGRSPQLFFNYKYYFGVKLSISRNLHHPMSDLSLQDLFAAIKSLEKANNLSTAQIAERLGKSQTTINKWKREQTLNALGVPFTENYHYTNKDGFTFFADRCEAWLRNETSQYDEWLEFRQKVFKIGKKKIAS